MFVNVVVPLKDKKGITIVNAFQKIFSKGCKPNKIWVDQGGEFYNNSFKRFQKLKLKCRNKYSNIVHRKIKIKPINLRSGSYAKYNEGSHEKYSKFKISESARMSKHENIFVEGYTSNWLEEVFVVSKNINTVLWTYFVSDLNS